jgi:hypothetical protein
VAIGGIDQRVAILHSGILVRAHVELAWRLRGDGDNAEPGRARN